jgi:drug/metabolite transporter (DMT)-like permease
MFTEASCLVICAAKWISTVCRIVLFPYRALSTRFPEDAPMKISLDQKTQGWLNGCVGMLIFSGTLPATRLGIGELGAMFMTSMRAAVAGVISLVLLMCWPQARPSLRDMGVLLIVATGVVLGFPLLTSLALRQITAAHAMVFVGLLPLCTAIWSAVLTGERPRPAFWSVAILGSLIVMTYALTRDHNGSLLEDGLMIAAIVLCGLGYAQGARLARRLGAWQVISWALVIALPVSIPCAISAAPAAWTQVSTGALLGLAYVCLFSMLLGFVFWYRGLAQGGIAAVGQLQLLQPFFGLLWAALLLGEAVNTSMFIALTAIVACVVIAKRLTRTQTSLPSGISSTALPVKI